MTQRLHDISACVFDAYGTLFDVASAARACRDVLGDAVEKAAALWRDKQLQYTWLRVAQDRHADFWQVTGDALDFTLETLGLERPGLRERLMRAGLTGNEAQSRNQANALLNSDWMREQLRPLFRSPQDFDGFMRSVNAEHLMFATRTDLIRGSQTAGRMAEDQAPQTLIEQHGAGAALDVAHRNWLGLLWRVGGALRDRIKDREVIANQAVNNQVARILFGPIDPEAAQALLRGMSGPRARVQLENPMQVPADILQRLAPGGGSPLAR